MQAGKLNITTKRPKNQTAPFSQLFDNDVFTCNNSIFIKVEHPNNPTPINAIEIKGNKLRLAQFDPSVRVTVEGTDINMEITPRG